MGRVRRWDAFAAAGVGGGDYNWPNTSADASPGKRVRHVHFIRKVGQKKGFSLGYCLLQYVRMGLGLKECRTLSRRWQASWPYPIVVVLGA